MKKTLAFLLLLAIIIMPANAVEKENVKPVKNVILFNPGRNLIGDYLYRPLVAMVPRSQQTEIEHRPVFVRNGAYAFF